MVFILLTLVFLLMRVAPGDPISASLGGPVPQEEIDRIKDELGFDQPIYEPVRRLPRRHRAGRLRHDDHRPPARSATSSS